MRALHRITAAAVLLLPFAGSAAPPAAKKEPVKDTYHGMAVVDNYRWLENAADPEVRSWSDAQNKYARSYLAGLPAVDRIKSRLREILTARTTRYSRLARAGHK